VVQKVIERRQEIAIFAEMTAARTRWQNDKGKDGESRKFEDGECRCKSRRPMGKKGACQNQKIASITFQFSPLVR